MVQKYRSELLVKTNHNGCTSYYRNFIALQSTSHFSCVSNHHTLIFSSCRYIKSIIKSKYHLTCWIIIAKLGINISRVLCYGRRFNKKEQSCFPNEFVTYLLVNEHQNSYKNQKAYFSENSHYYPICQLIRSNFSENKITQILFWLYFHIFHSQDNILYWDWLNDKKKFMGNKCGKQNTR